MTYKARHVRENSPFSCELPWRNPARYTSLSEKDIGAGGLTLELRVKVGRNKKAEAEHYPNAIKQANQFDYAKGDQAIRASPDR
jgi:hypothetical protein